MFVTYGILWHVLLWDVCYFVIYVTLWHMVLLMYVTLWHTLLCNVFYFVMYVTLWCMLFCNVCYFAPYVTLRHMLLCAICYFVMYATLECILLWDVCYFVTCHFAMNVTVRYMFLGKYFTSRCMLHGVACYIRLRRCMENTNTWMKAPTHLPITHNAHWHNPPVVHYNVSHTQCTLT